MTTTALPFFHAHATHPDWRMALALTAAQLDGQRAQAGVDVPPTLGWVYFAEAYAGEAGALLADLRLRWPGTQWIGGSGAGVLASGVEYRDEPALAVMLADLDPSLFRVFSGQRPLSGFPVGALQVHADLQAPDLPELLQELAGRTRSGRLFGGVVHGRMPGVQIAGEVLDGGVSGLALHPLLPVITRLTQGCQAIGPVRRVTRFERNQVLSLDGQPALDCLLDDLGLNPGSLGAAVPRLGTTLAGLVASDAALEERAGEALDSAVQVRRLVGVSPSRGGVALAEDLDEWSGDVPAGHAPAVRLAFCRRDAGSAWRDLVRVCSEIRDELLPEDEAWALSRGATPPDPGEDPTHAWVRARVAGAIYISSSGRGGEHFGGPSAELQTVRQALGDVPLVGLFAAGEIAGDRLHSFAGVLTVFVREEVQA